MTTTWTDDDLDAALTELGALLDTPGASALATVRARLAPEPTDVVEIGRPSPAGRRRLGPAVLVAAAVVAAVVAALVFWPRGGADRSAPGASPSPAPADVIAARQALLLEPVLDGATVLVSIAGVGDATVSLPSIATSAGQVTIAYGFDCGDPRFGGDPNGPDNDVSEFTLTDNLGTVTGGSCAPIASGTAVAGFGTGRPLDPAGRAKVRVDVPSEDTVWRFALTSTPR